MKRYSNLLYVFEWDDVTKNLTLRPGYPKTLENCPAAFDIALDEFRDTLWTADSDENVVRAYDVSSCLSSGVWNENTSKTIRGLSHQPVAGNNGLCLHCFPLVRQHRLEQDQICKFDLKTMTETTCMLTDQGFGVAVDELTDICLIRCLQVKFAST